MESLLRNRATWVSGVVLVLAVLLTACQPDASSEIISPQLGEQLAAAEAGSAVAVVPTPPPPKIADMTEEEIYAGLDADVASAIAAADPDNGSSLALSNACVGCHSLDPEATMTGPTWHNVGDAAVTRVDGQSPAQYLYISITAPNDFVVANYPANIMPQNYGDTLSDDDLADLVAYLLAQHE